MAPEEQSGNNASPAAGDDAAGATPGRKKHRLRGGLAALCRMRWLRWGVFAAVWVGLAWAAAAGLAALNNNVRTEQKRQPVAVQVRLFGQPTWMPDSLSRSIARTIVDAKADFNDLSLTSNACRNAAANPWIRKVVRTEKHPTDNARIGVLDVYAEFRVPVAKVLLRDGHTTACIADDGVRLPDEAPEWAAFVRVGDSRKPSTVYFMRESQIPLGAACERVHYMLIDGAADDPPAVGSPWTAADVQAGLSLANMLWLQPYVNQVALIDVRNFGQRLSKADPELLLVARRQGAETRILFGRLPNPEGDWEVPSERKIRNLSLFVRNNKGALAGVTPLIDIQKDQLTFPAPQVDDPTHRPGRP